MQIGCNPCRLRRKVLPQSQESFFNKVPGQKRKQSGAYDGGRYETEKISSQRRKSREKRFVNGKPVKVDSIRVVARLQQLARREIGQADKDGDIGQERRNDVDCMCRE